MNKKLFFGAEITAPWPNTLPQGRLIEEHSRHLTLAFLGNVSYEAHNIPLPEFKVGLIGVGDHLLFLPEKHPRVVAYHIRWPLQEPLLLSFQSRLVSQLQQAGHTLSTQSFLSHVTIAREPFVREDWKQTEWNLPFLLKAIHLYESVGNLTYLPLWSHPLALPFEEQEHTADIAFLIRAETIEQLHLNAQAALAFKHPLLMPYLEFDRLQNSLDDLIIQLNRSIARADAAIGCPFKAVSFHGNILRDASNILHWEMIVDV